MGNGDNRRTLKMRRRKSQRKLKTKLKNRIEEGKARKAAGGKKKTGPAKATVTRKGPTA